MSELIIPNQRKQDVNVTTHEGKLVIQFNPPVQNWVMSIEEGAELLKALNGQMRELIKKNKANDYSLN